jgi:hypothetical protein
MSQKLCAKTYITRPIVVRLSLFGTLAWAIVALGNTGCEDKAIGRPCDVFPGDAGITGPQALYNPLAVECPSRICIKPAAVQGASPDTTALCSAPCSQDSDCDPSQARTCNSNDPNCHDRRCTSGFACAIPFITGPICCQKLCVCKDFYGSSGITTPPACQGSGAATCQ